MEAKNAHRELFFLNRTIKNWNQLPAEELGTFPCKPKIFRNKSQENNYKPDELKGTVV